MIKKTNKIKDAFSNIEVSDELDKKILNKTIYRKIIPIRKLRFVYIFIFTCICLVSISAVYAEEIESVVNTVIYKYISKEDQSDLSEYGVNEEATGIHLVKPNNIIEVKDLKLDKEVNTIEEAEKALNMKFLKLKDFNYKYVTLLLQTEETGLSMPGKYYKDNIDIKPEIISINGSNYKNFKCFITFDYNEDGSVDKESTEKTRKKCQDEWQENMPDKQLSITMYFATQYASKETIDRVLVTLSDFPNGETKIYDSKNLNSKVYQSRWEEFFFIYENIIYKIESKHKTYDTEEILEMIEHMEY